MQDDPAAAFDAWAKLLGENEAVQDKARQSPKASLIKFLYDKPNLKDQD